MSKNCTICVVLGIITPWLLIISGAILSVLKLSDGLDKTAAYAVAFGFFLLAGSAVLRHILSRLVARNA